jgi:adenylylsulfate kinase-like enzyme
LQRVAHARLWNTVWKRGPLGQSAIPDHAAASAPEGALERHLPLTTQREAVARVAAQTREPRPAPEEARQISIDLVLLVLTGPIACGKSTLALAVASELERRGEKAAAIDLDLIYEMVDPARGPKTNQAKWMQARRLAACLANALLSEHFGVVVEGEFLTPGQRAEFTDVLGADASPRFVSLRVPFDEALRRARADPTRGVSCNLAFLRDHYAATEEAVRNASASDFAVDTSTIGIGEAARAIIDWALR